MHSIVSILPTNSLWYFFPLVVAISLVYGATRHELIVPICENVVRSAIWILTFMGSIFAVLFLVAWWL